MADVTEKLIDAIAKTIKGVEDRLIDRIKALEGRIAALETAPKGLSYAGTWQRATEYRRHQGVTHKGSLWITVTDSTRDEPGLTSAWQLAERRT